MEFSDKDLIMPGKDMNSPYCKVCSCFIPERFSPEALAEVIDTILAQNGRASGVGDYSPETCCYLCKNALQRNQSPTKFQQMLMFLTNDDTNQHKHHSPSGCLTVCLGVAAVLCLIFCLLI